MIPIVFVTVSEHIGHQMVLNKIVGRNFLKSLGLINQSLVMVFLQCLPVLLVDHQVQPGENMVYHDTRYISIYVIGGAAVIAIVLALIILMH